MNGQYPGIEPDRKPEDSLKFPRSETKKEKSFPYVKMEISSNSSFLEHGHHRRGASLDSTQVCATKSSRLGPDIFIIQ